MSGTVQSSQQLDRLNEALARLDAEGHWTTNRDGLPPAPEPLAQAHHWRWADIRPLLMEAGECRAIEGGAGRRTVRFCSPGLRTKTATNTIHASVQLVKPGEIAEAHRHTIGALRFVIEGEGGYTMVEGERFFMEPGDLVLTPQGTWHDHANETATPMVWLDGHDLPLVRSLNVLFFETYNADRQDRSQDDGASRLRAGGLRPRGAGARTGGTPYAYKGTEAIRLLKSLDEDAFDPHDGVTLDYIDPITGGPALPTIGCRLHLIEKGRRLDTHRHTSNTIYHVAEGAGQTVAGGRTFDWEKGDTFVVPAWTWHSHAAPAKDGILFAMSDEPVMSGIGLFRTETAGAASSRA